MLAELRKHLEEKGADPSILDDFQVVDNEVEVDALTEAIDALSKAMKKEDKPAETQVNLFDDEDMDDEDMDDEDMDDEDMEKGYYKDALKALASGTDSVIADMEKRMSAVMKGLEAILGEMKGMKASNEAMNKSLTASLNATMSPRAIQSAPAPAVQQAPAEPSRHDVIRKGLRLIQDSKLDNSRKASIRSAIAQLEAGVPVSSITHLIDLD